MGLASLDGLPRLVQVRRRCLADCSTTGHHLGLYLLEATGKLVSSLAQTVLGVDLPKPRHVDDREEDVAELLTDALGAAAFELVAHFRQLFLELVPRVLPARPIEAHAPRLDLEPLSAKESGQCGGHALER